MPSTTQIPAQTAQLVRRIRAFLPKAMLRDRAAANRKLHQLQKSRRGGQRFLEELRSIEKRFERSVEERSERFQFDIVSICGLYFRR